MLFIVAAALSWRPPAGIVADRNAGWLRCWLAELAAGGARGWRRPEALQAQAGPDVLASRRRIALASRRRIAGHPRAGLSVNRQLGTPGAAVAPVTEGATAPPP